MHLKELCENPKVIFDINAIGRLRSLGNVLQEEGQEERVWPLVPGAVGGTASRAEGVEGAREHLPDKGLFATIRETAKQRASVVARKFHFCRQKSCIMQRNITVTRQTSASQNTCLGAEIDFVSKTRACDAASCCSNYPRTYNTPSYDRKQKSAVWTTSPAHPITKDNRGKKKKD